MRSKLWLAIAVACTALSAPAPAVAGEGEPPPGAVLEPCSFALEFLTNDVRGPGLADDLYVVRVRLAFDDGPTGFDTARSDMTRIALDVDPPSSAPLPVVCGGLAP